jgi:hypothetical protein
MSAGTTGPNSTRPNTSFEDIPSNTIIEALLGGYFYNDPDGLDAYLEFNGRRQQAERDALIASQNNSSTPPPISQTITDANNDASKQLVYALAYIMKT